MSPTIGVLFKMNNHPAFEARELAWWCPSRDHLARNPPSEGAAEFYGEAPVPGRAGLHASTMLLDALAYGESPLVCRVALEGRVSAGVGQRCARVRRVLWIADVSIALRDLAATTLPVLWRRVVAAFDDEPEDLELFAEGDLGGSEEVAEAALGLREKADDERRSAEWRGKDPARIVRTRRRAAAAHAAVLLTDGTSEETAHLSRTAERIADASAWLAYTYEGACGTAVEPVPLASVPDVLYVAACNNCGELSQRWDRCFLSRDRCPACFATELYPAFEAQ